MSRHESGDASISQGNPFVKEGGDSARTGLNPLLRGSLAVGMEVDDMEAPAVSESSDFSEEKALFDELVKFSLLCADLLILLLLAAYIAMRSAPLTIPEIAGCVISVTLAAWLGCLAFLFRA